MCFILDYYHLFKHYRITVIVYIVYVFFKLNAGLRIFSHNEKRGTHAHTHKHTHPTFADDAILYREIKSNADCTILQAKKI